MTAIGAMPEGFDPPTADEIDRVDGPTIAAWAADVRQWLVGPYTGASTPATLRYRALALVAVAEGAAAGLTTPTAQAAGLTPPPVTGSTASEPHSPAGVVAANTARERGGPDVPVTESPSIPEVIAEQPGPGSVGDPAYTSPTPIAGERVEPQDQPGPDAPGEGQQPVPDSPPQP